MNDADISAQMLEHVERWRRWARTEVDALVELACKTGLEGGGPWDEALRRWGVAFLSAEERTRHARVGPPRSGGPPPIEVRRAAEAVARHTGEQLDAFERDHQPPLHVEGRIDRLRHELDGFGEEALRAYLGKVRPKPTTANIFATARATSRLHLAGAAGPGLSTLSCHSCGAPRTKGATSRTCEFCGSTF